MTSKAEEYRRHVQECLDAAKESKTQRSGRSCFKIAQRWMRLAEGQDALSSSTEPARQQQAANCAAYLSRATMRSRSSRDFSLSGLHSAISS
jgi:hypothetical protein